jgi:hypothetical protein
MMRPRCVKPVKLVVVTVASAIGFAMAPCVAGWALPVHTAPRRTPSPLVTPGRDLPVVREASYVVNARVRPLLLFWIGRDNVGDARLTWRAGSGNRRAFELVVGTVPARAPRQINQWGFLVEALDGDTADVLGLMKDSNEKTLEEADARTAREEGSLSAFKAIRATITPSRATSVSMTLNAPANTTYRELDELLALLPAEPPKVRTLELPPGTQTGFLAAMDTLIRSSIEPCRTANHRSVGDVPHVPYVYSQTIYDLSLLSCALIPQLRTATQTFGHVVDGRFRVRDRTTKSETDFRVSYGTTGTLRELPIRVEFRPHWWMEVELVLDGSSETS